MAVTESVVSKKYRILVDAANRVWNRISFWTKAEDVETAAGDNLEDTVGWIKGKADSLTIGKVGYIPDADMVANSISSTNLTVQNLQNSIINYGTTALTAGTSSLDTGTFYWQYK